MAPDTELLHPVEVLKGADGRSIYSSEVSDLFISSIHECLKSGKLKEIEYPVDVEAGRHFFQARIAPFEGNKVLALIHDIGDRMRRSQELLEAKQRAEEADRMKSVFLANMSHEIRTPLNAIVGFSEIIALTEDEKEKEEYLGIIQQNSNLLLQLINDILDLSRIESGKSEMHCQLTEMSGLVDEVDKVHRLKMKKGVKLNVIRSSEEIWISTDRNRVTQVLFNFLSNAIKNTIEGSITFGLVKEEEWVKLYVTDTGCGISKEKLPLIFTRFEKLNDFVQGTGLGLPICKSIVERLGGRIEVESELGQGSTFILYLPNRQVQEVVVGERENAAGNMGVENRQKKILIAEDVESSYLQINAFLKKEYTILWVPNGEEAVKSFIREKPDLILMDIRMPVMNGIQATAKIRAISQEIPIIAITAYAFCPEGERALEAGCNEVIAKPYPLEKLKETIETYL
jgi:two-component system sensor histidine kinase